MPATSNYAEGGTNGVTVTTANSGGGSGDAFVDAGNAWTMPKFSNAHPANGSMGVLMGDTLTRYGVGWDAAWSTSVFGRVYVYVTGLFGGYITGEPWTTFGSAFAPYWLWNLNGTSGLSLRNSSNAQVAIGSTVVVVNTLYRIEWHSVSSAAAGVIEARIYLGHSQTATETVGPISGIAGNGANIVNVTHGHDMSGASSTAEAVYADDFAASTVTWLGPSAFIAAPETLGTVTSPMRW